MKSISRILFIACLAFFASCSSDDDHETPIQDYKAGQIFSTITLYQSVARQPEMTESLIYATIKLAQYDTITDILPLNDKAEEERGIARGQCLSECFEAIARQPEAYDLVEKVAEKFLGIAKMETMSEKILEYSCLHALTGVNNGLVRQPEALDLFDKFGLKFLGVSVKKVTASE